MRLSKDELIAKVKAYTGDRTDDETLTLIEDVTDTITGVDVNWEEKYNDLAKKYKDRFTESGVEEKETEEPEEKEDIKIDDLFKEGE